MATSLGGISSPGVGSGLDVNGIVRQLVAIESRPLSTLQADAGKLQTRMSAMGQLQSLVSSLRDAAGGLAKPESYTAMSVSSSDSTAVSATLASGAKPAAGSYTVAATSLSTSQTLANAAGQFTAATDTVGSGSLKLQLGTWAEDLSGFTAKTGSTEVTLSIAADDSLSAIRDKINAANAGVSAALVTDTTGVRLTIRSTATGAENGFRIQATDDDGSHTNDLGLSRLAYDPAGGAAQMTRPTAAADARATVNGIEVRSATDTFAGVVEGLSIKLGKAPATGVTLTVSANTDAVKGLVTRFATAYNGLAKWLGDQTRYDAETGRAGMFQGDSTVVGLQSQLRSIIGSASLASPDFQTLSSLGIEQQKDGTLQVNGARLDAALARMPDAAAALSRLTEGQPMLTGAAVRLRDWADGLLNASGALPSRNKSLQDRLAANQRDQERVQQRVDLFEKRLRAQYATLDQTVSQYNGLSGYVSQQLTALANANSSSGNR